ncbi:MAG: PKD domain-containing protein [Saprospiraceae bacterium]
MITNKIYHILYILFLTIGYHTTHAQCSFTFSDTAPCAGVAVDLNVNGPDGSTAYSWDLDNDGTPDQDGAAITHRFPILPQEVNYPITLFANGTACASDTLTVLATPDATIGVPPGIVTLIDREIRACNGASSLELSIFNASASYAQNEGYTINWGDGSPSENYDNTTFSNTNTISHTYTGYGYFTIFFTVRHNNGCVFTNTYTFYNGGNPSVGLVIPGNTVGLCAPATLDFPIINTESNPPGTEYTVYINGEEVAHYTQDSLPEVFTHTFEESSCGETTSTGNYTDAFDIKIVASNPCNSSTATIEPIEVSSPPDPDFVIIAPPNSCAGSTYTFNNNTTNVNEVVSGNPSACIDVLNPSWTISGVSGEDWNIVSGNLFNSNSIDIEFLNPGVYTIEMTVISFACGPFKISQQITIYDEPSAMASPILTDIISGGACTPVTIPLVNNSQGNDLSYEWVVNSEFDWAFVDSTNAQSKSPSIQFMEGGAYELILRTTNPCATVQWDTTLMMPGPPTINLIPLADSCASAILSFDTLNLQYQSNGLPFTSYHWNFPGGSTATSTEAYPMGISYDTAGTYIVSLEAANRCGSYSIADTFVVQALSDLELPADTTLCASEPPFQLVALPAGGTWSGNGVHPNGLFQPAQANTGGNVLTYHYGVGACSMSDHFTITIIPAPTVTAGPDISICSNEENQLLTGSPANGIWSSSLANIVDGNQFITGVAGPGLFTLTYSLTDGNSCRGVDSLTVLVREAPTVAVADSAYCNSPGATALPLASPAGGTWSGPGVVAPNTGLFDPIIAGGPGSYQLNYTITNANGCSSSAIANIGVIDPVSVDAGQDTSLCMFNGTYNLSFGANPSGGRWSGIGNGLNGNLFDPIAAGPGTFQLHYMVGAGSCAFEDVLTITVIAPMAVVAGPDESICADAAPFSLNGNSPTGGTWTGNGIADSQSGIFDPSLVDVGSHTLTYRVQDAQTGCPAQAEKTIVLNPSPIPNFTVSPIICIGQQIDLENLSEGSDSFSWNFGDGSASVSDPSPSYTYSNAGNYDIQLITSNAAACQAIFTQNIQVVAPPQALFAADAYDNCGQLSTNLTNQSQGFENTYLWHFGNGQTAATETPPASIVYEGGRNDTMYVVHLEASNRCGVDVISDTFLVRAFPIVDFGFTVDTGCAPLNVYFANISQGSPTAFYWDFGNGNFSTDSLPSVQTFEADTATVSYPIRLIASNACGADTLQKTLLVEPEKVNAFFNINRTVGCAPFELSFENFSTPGTMVQWDFGDGNGASIANPSHTFVNPGTYTITQYASNTCAEDSTKQTIRVLEAPTVDFEFSPNLCQGQEIQFTNHSTNLASTSWSFGTGDTSVLANPVYTFPQTGSFTIQLTGTSLNNACSQTISKTISIGEAPKASFSMTAPNGCTPLSMDFQQNSHNGQYYQWDFGDGNTSVEANPAHTYLVAGNYTVKLRVSNPSGCYSDTSYTEIFAYPVPKAVFSYEKESTCGLPVNVHFNNESVGGEGYHWNFSGDLSSNFVHPTQTFYQAGDFPVHLWVSNTYGCEDTTSQMLRFYESPLADFELDTIIGCEPMQVQFTNLGVGNHFSWDFGDGTQSTAREPKHTYTEAGLYDLRLIAAFDDICADSLVLPAYVEVMPTATASFLWSAEQINGKATGFIQFQNTSEDADRFFWDFGDGATSEELHPGHRYYENGLKQVYLQAIASNGCPDDTLLVLEPGFIHGLQVPNAFAPEQGLGDAQLFLPKGISLKEYRLQIFSPYGELLWESTELDEGKPAEGWDGTHQGHPLPQDVYVWKIQAIFEDGMEWRGMKMDAGGYKRIGSVTLLR